MPKVSRESATGGGEFGPVTDRSDQIDGYTVNFTSFAQAVDGTPLMKGLGYGKGYEYAHEHEENVVRQQHRPAVLEGRKYYDPTDNGFEKTIRERLERVRKLK